MNKRIALAGGVALACSIFGTSVHSAQPVQVLTLDQFNQAASSPVSPRVTRHHRQAQRNVLAGSVGSHKGESGDPIAAFAGDMAMDGHNRFGRHGEADAISLGVAAGFYRVNLGDSVGRIAAAFGQKPKDLMNWNGLTSGSLIRPGQVLRVGPFAQARSPALTR